MDCIDRLNPQYEAVILDGYFIYRLEVTIFLVGKPSHAKTVQIMLEIGRIAIAEGTT